MPEVIEVADKVFDVTERAGRRIAEIVRADGGAKLLRISVEGGGCSGFQYKFDLVDHADADDMVIDRAGARVAIDPVSLDYMRGSQLDFVDDLIGAAFKVKNPLAVAACGCGTSFTL